MLEAVLPRPTVPHPATAGLPAQPGVYRFRDVRDRVLYVGRATDLRSRVRSYWGDLRDRRHLLRMVPAVAAVEAVACVSVHEAAWLERNLLETALPRWNRTRGGQESPVLIRLDAGPGRPGLRTVHESGAPAVAGGRLFGPYLGGLRVRQAVSALHRVLPLAYTGDRLAGSAREMALKMGVPADDPDRRREAMAAALVAVLDRDPGAVAEVVAGLERLRDKAAAALAFELAGRVQEEIEALRWVTSAQRVTVPGAGDVEAYGYAGGVLVQFTVRDGRVRRWRRRRGYPADRAAPLVAGTPPRWRDFAGQAAELAARLGYDPSP